MTWQSIKTFFISKKTLYGMGIIVGVCVLGGVLLLVGWYPVAAVNGHLLWGNAFYHAHESGLVYWRALLSQQQSTSSQELDAMVRVLAFESIIDDFLITKKLSDDMGEDILKDKLSNTLIAAMADQTLLDNLSTLGITKETDKKFVINQISEYNLLDGTVRLEKTTGTQWLMNARKEAKVHIFLPGYSWKNGNIHRK